MEPHVTATRTYAHTRLTRESRTLTREVQSVAALVDGSICNCSARQSSHLTSIESLCLLGLWMPQAHSGAYFGAGFTAGYLLSVAPCGISAKVPGAMPGTQLILNEYTSNKFIVIC